MIFPDVVGVVAAADSAVVVVVVEVRVDEL
jgi:hypothetical protein